MKAYDGSKPSVGRIVHFYTKELAVGPCAGIITAVNAETDCNIFVFPVNAGYGEVVRAQYCDEPKAGHWTWPPRV